MALLPGTFSPFLIEAMVRLGTWLPFEQVPEVLAFFTGVPVSAETVRRLTEAAGAAQVAQETAEVAQLEQAPPAPRPGPAVQYLGLDGAMVPLVGGEWAEVKTLALGTVTATPTPAGPPEVHTADHSYFSRLTTAEEFGRLAWGELHRRGTETAGVVCAVLDGAPWLQGFVDLHRPDAVRILDFAHAAAQVSTAAQAVFGAGTPALSEWLSEQLHALKHGDPDAVLTTVRALDVTAAQPAEAAATRDAVVQYLVSRRPQIRYAAFQALGYPIGSGVTESANKLVVEVRLKGAGMHWARPHVNPMLALRGLACSDRWAESWAPLWQAQRQAVAERRRQRQQVRARQAATAPPSAPAASVAPPPPLPSPSAPPRTAPAPPAGPKLVVNGRPTAAHPWKRPFLPRRQARPPDAET